MVDSRTDRLARLIVEYSLDLGPGQVLRIDGNAVAEPLLLAAYRHAIERGAHAYVAPAVDGVVEALLAEGSEAQLTYISPGAPAELERLDALITVWAESNTRSLSGADPDRQRVMVGARQELAQRRMQRIFSHELAWCGTLFPTQAHAQDAQMSLSQYERFVYGACHVLEGDSDPVEHWRGVSHELAARAKELQAISLLRILGPDTDLRVSVAGRSWIAADGHRNMPDGEVFTSPVESATQGEIRYTAPATFQGREVEDVRLRFDCGEVVSAEAVQGEEYLRQMLAVDGASVLGEVAFGLNYEIDRLTGNILFDEKIGGTMHLALGASFPPTGGTNTSALHWDMICDLRDDGEVYADGELVWKAGRFLRPPAELES